MSNRSKSSVIRASEVGTYLYCQRAWFYQRQGEPSANAGDMAAGMRLHQQHAKTTFQIQLIRLGAYLLLITALILFTIEIIR